MIAVVFGVAITVACKSLVLIDVPLNHTELRVLDTRWATDDKLYCMQLFIRDPVSKFQAITRCFAICLIFTKTTRPPSPNTAYSLERVRALDQSKTFVLRRQAMEIRGSKCMAPTNKPLQPGNWESMRRIVSRNALAQIG